MSGGWKETAWTWLGKGFCRQCNEPESATVEGFCTPECKEYYDEVKQRLRDQAARQ